MSAPFPRGLTAIIKTVLVPASARGSDEEILERIERQLEERQQEYNAEGFIWRLRDARRTISLNYNRSIGEI
jgi:hypothetical protein